MADPFREQRLDPERVRRIVRRAFELADRDPNTESAGRALTREELEQAAADVGLPASAIAAAIQKEPGTDAASQQKASWFFGAPTLIVFDEEVDGEPTDADREDILEEIHAAFGSGGSAERIGKTLAWTASPNYRGRGRELSIRIRSRNGKTRIVAEEKLTSLTAGLFVGLGVGGGIGPMGGYIVAMIKLGILGVVFPLLWIPIMLLLARTIFGAIARKRERELGALMQRLKDGAAAWSAPKVRVDARVRTVEADDTAELESLQDQEAHETGARTSARRI